jgi:hypothetical protein
MRLDVTRRRVASASVRDIDAGGALSHRTRRRAQALRVWAARRRSGIVGTSLRMTMTLDDLRCTYAETIASSAGLKTTAVVEALATIPREDDRKHLGKFRKH